MKTKQSAIRVADLIREGLEEAVAFVRGEKTGARVRKVPITARHVSAKSPPAFERAQVIELRRRMGLSQAVFADALNVSPETVKAWEQGKNTPGGPALRLLELAEESPGIILRKVQVVTMKYQGPKPGRTAAKVAEPKRHPVARKK